MFTPEAIAKIARFSRGTPRIINGLCDNCLLYGFTGKTTTIDEKIVDKVLKHSMHLVPKSHTPTRSPFGGETTYAPSPQPRPASPVTQDPVPVAAVETPAPVVPPPVVDLAAAEASLADEDEAKKKSLPPKNLPFPTLRQNPPHNLAQ